MHLRIEVVTHLTARNPSTLLSARVLKYVTPVE
jgi:hypothetical protein